MFQALLEYTAWPMKKPAPYSLFHLLITLTGTAAAFLAAFFLSRKKNIPAGRIIFGCGIILAAAEIYKQLFLYHIVRQGSFDWWYFPFQLCSIPMYLCLLYPVCLKKHTPVFLQDFGLLGGITALLFPEGFLHPYVALTLHGFIWHFILVFLALYCHGAGLCQKPGRSFCRALVIYFFCLAGAVGINAFVQQNLYPAGFADMFYINCTFPSAQPVFHQISLILGNFWGHFAYILASCLGAGLIHLSFSSLSARREKT